MRNLLAFVRQFRGFVAFATLQIIALYFYFQYMNYGSAELYNTSSAFNGWINKQKSAISDYFHLKEENQRLMAENAELREKQPISFIQLQKRVYYINDTLYKKQFEYIPAHVINSTYTKRNNFYTIDVGTKNGIHYGMGVMSTFGVVGYVIDASEHYALVKTVLTQQFNLSAKHKKTNFFGLLKWDGKDYKIAQLTGVPKDAIIEEGDTIVTKGATGFFPPGVNIGIVDDIRTEAGDPHHFINVKLFNDFAATYNVYILDNMMKEEMKTLELKIKEENEDE